VSGLTSRRAHVLSISNRAAAGVYEDTTGPRIVAALEDAGFGQVTSGVVPDGEPVSQALKDAVAGGVDVIVTTGGTGLTPTDRTPEMTRTVLDREVPGIAEAIRAYGASKGIQTAALSRGLAGVAGSTLVVNLPGSTGGVKDGLAVLLPILEHALDQIAGGDHVRTDHASAPALDHGGAS
jgi:molybdenum cofactor synthesis domain-containing protein